MELHRLALDFPGLVHLRMVRVRVTTARSGAADLGEELVEEDVVVSRGDSGGPGGSFFGGGARRLPVCAW